MEELREVMDEPYSWRNKWWPADGPAAEPLTEFIHLGPWMILPYSWCLARSSGSTISSRCQRPSSQQLPLFGSLSGFHVLSEILGTEKPGCPAEFLNIRIPSGDLVFDPEGTGAVVLPFQRIHWALETGQSPNSPREQVEDCMSFALPLLSKFLFTRCLELQKLR